MAAKIIRDMQPLMPMAKGHSLRLTAAAAAELGRQAAVAGTPRDDASGFGGWPL